MVANSSAVAEGKKVKDYYASANGTTIQDFYMPKASKATPSLATSKQKGDLVGDYYIWNRVHTISSEDLKTVYVAAAYIKVNDDIVFLKEVRFSAKTIAGDYIQNRGYAEDTAEYSLRALANLE